jgi:N6-L-threonylcarbamoyladenine synthase
MINSKDLNFSFSGLKTSVLYYLRDQEKPKAQDLQDLAQRGGASRAIREHANMRVLGNLGAKADVAASFEQAVVDVLVKKTLKAVEMNNPKVVALGGGVAANDKLRKEFSKKLGALLPEKQFTGDNAAMIAVAAYYKALANKFSKPESIEADGGLKL